MCFGAWADPFRALTRSINSSRVGRASPRAHDESGDSLAPFVVGHADHGDHRDIGDVRQHVLDLARKDVESAADDHVLLAVENEHVAARRRRGRCRRCAASRSSASRRSVPGRFQYSAITYGARTQISPGSPVATSWSSSSRILTSHAAIGNPQDRNSSGRFRIVVRLAQHRDRIAFGLAVELREHRADALDALDQSARRHRRGAVKQQLERGQVGACSSAGWSSST